VTTTECPRLTTGQQTAIRRWKLGHHAFHLYLLAMNTELPVALDLLERRSWHGLTASLHKLIRLYDAATASMKYAADFDPAEYEQLIRPSMAPPFLSPGFSGEQNADHSTMLGLMARTQTTMKRLLRNSRLGDIPADVRAAATALWAAQSRNRRHHVLVCDKFVPGGGSLLKDHFARSENQLVSHGEEITSGHGH
jgi:tryptophan 2,3-dioxygenase